MKPTVIHDALAAEAKRSHDDQLGVFKEMLFRRTKDLADEGLAPALIAFEVLESAFSALAEGVPHAEVKDGYPVQSWRDNTVEIPADLLGVLLAGWRAYTAADAGRTLGECLGIEGGGQGKLPQKVQLANFNRERRLSNKAIVERFAQGSSWENAAAAVSEEGEASSATVRRASQKRRRRTLDELRRRGIIE